VNFAPSVRARFAVVPDLTESVTFTPSVVSLLRDVAQYDDKLSPNFQTAIVVLTVILR
jgi:hypothetical protein